MYPGSFIFQPALFISIFLGHLLAVQNSLAQPITVLVHVMKFALFHVSTALQFANAGFPHVLKVFLHFKVKPILTWFSLGHHKLKHGVHGFIMCK